MCQTSVRMNAWGLFHQPLQGALFCQFHDALMNYTDLNAALLDHRSVLCPQNQSQMTKSPMPNVAIDHDSAQAQAQAQECHVDKMTMAGQVTGQVTACLWSS